MPFDDRAKKAAAQELMAKAKAFIEEKAENSKKIEDFAARNRAIDKEIADIRAAARVLDLGLDLPDDEGDRHQLFLNRVFHGPGVGRTVARSRLFDFFAGDEKQPPPPLEMPKVSDLVLDRLKAAGGNGSKAAPIQEYIETTYNKKLHPKTVGMTLFRLQKQELVTRKGHVWFIAEAVNPEAATSGSVAQSKK